MGLLDRFRSKPAVAVRLPETQGDGERMKGATYFQPALARIGLGNHGALLKAAGPNHDMVGMPEQVEVWVNGVKVGWAGSRVESVVLKFVKEQAKGGVEVHATVRVLQEQHVDLNGPQKGRHTDWATRLLVPDPAGLRSWLKGLPRV